jgi:hypothetical protein
MNGGAWGVRNKGAGAYNPAVEEFVENLHEQEKEDNLNRYGASVITQTSKGLIYCDAEGNIKYLNFIERWMYNYITKPRRY